MKLEIEIENHEDYICRGDSGLESKIACKHRDYIDRELHKLGWCFSEKRTAGSIADSIKRGYWNKCGFVTTTPETRTSEKATTFVPSMKVAVTPTNPPVFVGSTNLPEGTGIYIGIWCAHPNGAPGCGYAYPAGFVQGGRFRAEVQLYDGAAKMRPDTYKVEFRVDAAAVGASAAEIAALGKHNEKMRGPEVFLLQRDVPGGREVHVPNGVPPPWDTKFISYIHELHIVVPPNDKSFAVR